MIFIVQSYKLSLLRPTEYVPEREKCALNKVDNSQRFDHKIFFA